MGNKKSRRSRLAAIVAQPKVEPEVQKKQSTSIVVQPDRPVLVQKDHIIDYPELYMEVFVTEPNAEIMFAEMFARAKCSQAKSLDKADLVVFTGGADVDPKMYEETPHKSTRVNKERDDRDKIYYVEALKNRIPMLGICRGAQFLHVMQGGKLIQDLDGHGSDHGILDHSGVVGGYIDRVSSTHHQAVIKNDDMEVLASVYKSSKRSFNRDVTERGSAEDIEAFFYRRNCILGIQGHPEYRGYSRFTNYCLKLIEHKLVSCPDIALENGKYRVKKEIIILDRQ